MLKRGRPLTGEKPLTSTERARTTRRRNAAKSRAYEVFANVVLMEIEAARVKSLEMTDWQARRIASRALMNVEWLTDRLSDLDAAADFFKLDVNGKLPPEMHFGKTRFNPSKPKKTKSQRRQSIDFDKKFKTTAASTIKTPLDRNN